MAVQQDGVGGGEAVAQGGVSRDEEGSVLRDGEGSLVVRVDDEGGLPRGNVFASGMVQDVVGGVAVGEVTAGEGEDPGPG